MCLTAILYRCTSGDKITAAICYTLQRIPVAGNIPGGAMPHINKTHSIGLLTPSSNTVQAPELVEVLPPNIALHSGRLSLTTIDPDSTVRIVEELEHESRKLGDADAGVIVLAATAPTSRKGKGADISSELKGLRADATRALSKLGVKDIAFLDFPDNAFDSVALLEIIKALEKLVAEKKPAVVYTHHWGDLNVDHRIAFNAVMTACRPFSSSVKRILCFEILSSTECSVQAAHTAFLPNHHIVLTRKELDKKLAALREYKTEMMKPPHPRSIGSVELLARYRGMTVNQEYAESFFIARDIETE